MALQHRLSSMDRTSLGHPEGVYPKEPAVSLHCLGRGRRPSGAASSGVVLSRLWAHVGENPGPCRGGTLRRERQRHRGGDPAEEGTLGGGGVRDEGPSDGGRCTGGSPGAGEAPQGLRFPDAVGTGARVEVNSLQLCHFVFLTTLCSQKRELSQGPVLFLRKGPSQPVTRRPDERAACRGQRRSAGATFPIHALL